MSGNHVSLFYQVTLVTLTFNLVNLKQYWSSLQQDQSACEMLKLWDEYFSRKWAETFFYKKDSCNLDLWLSEPNINKGHVRAKTNQHVKYESSVMKSYQDNELKTLLNFDPCDLYLWPCQPKILFSLRQIRMWNMKALW